jgi:hypothetical protein
VADGSRRGPSGRRPAGLPCAAVLTDESGAVPARRLAAAIEPFAGSVYFSPECHAAYERLGFGASPATLGGVAMPDGPAYFTSRGSLLGQVPGEVVAAAFAVFNPAVVVPAVSLGWDRTDAATIRAARAEGAVAQLRRILGPEPEGLDRVRSLLRRAVAAAAPAGKPMFAGVLAAGPPDDPLGEAWWAADCLRELRGDAHIAAWTAAGFDAVEIGLLTELWWGLPMRTYIRTRGWSDGELDAAAARLAARGLVSDGALTAEGRAARESVEAATDHQMRPVVDALGEELDELCGALEVWSAAVRAAGGYPDGILGLRTKGAADAS